MKILNPEGWMPPRGYSNVVVQGGVVHVAGQLGFNPRTGEFESDSFAAEVVQALRNVVEAVGAAGLGASDIVKLTWFVTDMDAYHGAAREIGKAWGSIFGTHVPAITLVAVSRLVLDRARVEIEAVAIGG